MSKQIAVAIIALTMMSAVPLATAADNNSCGLKGTYAFTGFGNTFEGNLLGFPPGVLSTNGTLTLDGNGNWIVRQAEVINGVLINPEATYAGPYTVNPDCTFSAMLPTGPAPIFVGVVADHGKQIRAMSTIPGVLVNYTNTIRVHP